MCGIECRILLDSGAKVSIARSELFPSEILRSLWELKANQSLVGIIGHDVGTVGCFEVEIDLGGPDVFIHSIWLAKRLIGLNVDVVIGQDILCDRKIDISMARKEAQYQGRRLFIYYL